MKVIANSTTLQTAQPSVTPHKSAVSVCLGNQLVVVIGRATKILTPASPILPLPFRSFPNTSVFDEPVISGCDILPRPIQANPVLSTVIGLSPSPIWVTGQPVPTKHSRRVI